jgi:hypothetical protein
VRARLRQATAARRRRFAASGRRRLRLARASPAIWALAVITVLGAGLRVYFLYQYRPALLGFPDSVVYVIDAHQGLFADPLRVSGYALFLRVLHRLSDHLLLVTIVQHGLGLLSGLLLFDAVRRARAPIGLGLLPAAVVMLGGSELMLEHALLTDSLFIFFTDLSIWFVVRSWVGDWRWALGAGLSMGCATIDRTVGLELLPFVLGALLIGPAAAGSRLVAGRRRRGAPAASGGSRGDGGARGDRGRQGSRPGLRNSMTPRPRARRALQGSGIVVAGLVGALLVIVPFVYAHKRDTGTWGFASASYFDLYGRVAPWADCSKFTPPAGTAKLCIHDPVSQRQGTEYWVFTGGSPAIAAYGSPEWYGPPPQKDENNQLRAFSEAAIEGQPLTYLEYVGRDLVRVVDPTFSSSPYRNIGNVAYGQTPEGQLDYYFDTSNLGNIEGVVNSYYHSPGVLARNVTALMDWDRDTRIEGPAMAIFLVLALLAPLLAAGGTRRLAILCTTVALVLTVAPILVVDYDWRFMIPVFGPLSVSTAIGGYEVWRRARSAWTARAVRRRARLA